MQRRKKNQIKELKFGVTKNAGGYEYIRLDITTVPEPGENETDTLARAVALVESAAITAIDMRKRARSMEEIMAFAKARGIIVNLVRDSQ